MPQRVRRRKLATQILASCLTILTVTVLLGFGLFTLRERQLLAGQYKNRALAIAETVAGDPTIQQAMEYGGGGDVVEVLADQVRRNSGAAYVRVINPAGILFSDPDPALVGHRTGVRSEAGGDGSGPWARAPLYGPSRNVVGNVSVGFLERDITDQLIHEVPMFALFSGLALAVGAAASYMLARRLRRTTFGLELHEIAALLSEREAMLHGVREGVVTMDGDGRVTLVNDEARRLLRLGYGVLNRSLDGLVPEGRLRDVLSGRVSGADQVVLTDEHCLEVNRMTVDLGGQNLGAIVTLRDRTELEGLLRELDNVRGLTDALRAQGHEFSNRMHTLIGMLELGHYDEALRYINDSEGAHATAVETVGERIASPLLAGLLLAKVMVAAERGVTLRLTDDSLLDDPRGRGQALMTVVGNLIDNAIDAATQGSGHGQVMVRIRQADDAIRVSVHDSGPGVPAGLAEEVFQDGFSTKDPRTGVRRGLGLALVRRVVQRLGGEISVSHGPGAEFAVVIPATGRLEPTVALR